MIGKKHIRVLPDLIREPIIPSNIVQSCADTPIGTETRINVRERGIVELLIQAQFFLEPHQCVDFSEIAKQKIINLIYGDILQDLKELIRDRNIPAFILREKIASIISDMKQKIEEK